jgi:hypothetical protein
MHGGLRAAYGHAVNFAKRHYGRAREIAGHIDRGLNTAYKIYQHIAPVIAPHARRALGDRADDIHKHIVDGARFYGDQRHRILQADRMSRALAGAVHKEIKGAIA